MKKVVILPDVHLTTETPKSYQLVKKFIKEQKPDEVIILGDYMDVSALSAWDLDKKRLIEGKRYEQEIVLANKELDFLQANAKKVTYLEGNHEDRVERYLDKNPELEGLMEIPKLLKLKERGIKWHKMNTLYKVGDCYFTHGMYTNTHHAKKHIQTLGCNIVYGHTHNPQTYMINMKMQTPIMSYGLGLLGDTNQPYLKNRPAQWLQQFAVMYVDETGLFNLYPINILKNSFMFNNKKYKLA